MKLSLKNIIFSVFPLLFIFLMIELIGRIVYYQRNSSHTFILSHIYVKIKHSYILDRANTEYKNRYENNMIDMDMLFSKNGYELHIDLMKKYEEYFIDLKKQIEKIDVKFALLYIPSDNYNSHTDRKSYRKYFLDLANKHSVDIIDLSETFYIYDDRLPTLLPENGHLSRFGNILVARSLKDYINNNKYFRSSYRNNKYPELLGDLKPDLNEIWFPNGLMPYKVITNSQGLRMQYNLSFPKEKQRVLLLGDSFTFGPYLSNHNTFAGHLQKELTEIEIINAGVAGYTIKMQLELFMERAKYVDPDFVILQVLDNDIIGLTSYKLNQFCRKNNFYPLTAKEKSLISKYEKKKNK